MYLFLFFFEAKLMYLVRWLDNISIGDFMHSSCDLYVVTKNYSTYNYINIILPDTYEGLA